MRPFIVLLLFKNLNKPEKLYSLKSQNLSMPLMQICIYSLPVKPKMKTGDKNNKNPQPKPTQKSPVGPGAEKALTSKQSDAKKEADEGSFNELDRPKSRADVTDPDRIEQPWVTCKRFSSRIQYVRKIVINNC